MTTEQKKWLADHPAFSPWQRHPGIVSLKGWTDVGYLYPNGRLIEGEGKPVPGYPGVLSIGDTIALIPYGTIKVGREYMIC